MEENKDDKKELQSSEAKPDTENINADNYVIEDQPAGPDVFTTTEADQAEDKKNLDQLTDLIHSKNYPGLRDFVANKDPIDIAYLINDLPDDVDAVVIFKSVPNKYTAEIFSYLDPDEQQKIVNAFSNKEVQTLIATMANDDIADFVEELPSNLVSKVISSTSPDDRKEINSLLNYKEDTAGSIMTTEYVSIKDGTTASEALKIIRSVGREAETITTTFVVDKTRKLIGSLSLDDLVFAEGNTKVNKLMDDDCISCLAETDQEDVASLMKKYDLTVIPVIDKEQRMLGIITIDDVMDVIESEQTEDLAKMAAMTPVEGDYLKTSVMKLAWARVPWLALLLIADTFTELLINSYEDALSTVPVLTVFIPMLMDTGGNAGGQTTTVVTRALSLNQITTKDYLKVLFKEFRVSLFVGIIVSVINFAWIYFEFSVGLIRNSTGTSGTAEPVWLIATLVAITGYAIIILSKTIGATLPLLAKKVHIDPAIMAGPLITSIVDTASLAIYFVLAHAILHSL